MGKFLKLHKFSLLLLITGLFFYASFAFDLAREDFIKLLSLYTALFFLSWKLIQLEKVNFWFLALMALMFRFVFIAAVPNLSQDFYRFIWDGRLLLEGLNPYIYLPDDLITRSNVPIAGAVELYNGMGSLSAGNYTNYPPLNQLIFALSALLAGKNILGSVIVMRLVVIAADIGVLYFGKKLLESVGLPGYRIFWYILNPLVIIEITGNLHFEGVMVFFLVLSIYLIHTQRWILSAVAMAASVLLKLIPLIFLPFLAFYFFNLRDSEKQREWQKLIIYYFIVGAIIFAGFLPFLSARFINGFTSSISLWFQKFEFNASIYYVVRWIGFQVKGYNIIETAGKILPVLIILIFAALAFFRRNYTTKGLITTMLFAATVYFFLSTTVHPWYLITPLFLSIFSPFRYMIIWSFLVILSYFTYSNPDFNENLWLVAIQYVIVMGYFAWELFKGTRANIIPGPEPTGGSKTLPSFKGGVDA